MSLDYYNRHHLINIRTWWRSDGDDEWKPGKTGIAMAVRHLPAIADAIDKALSTARELGLLNGGGEQ